MTREEIQVLKNYDLDAEIAKNLGWTDLHDDGGISWGKCPEFDYEDMIVPHYSGNLDMCQQAESTLTPDQWAKYLQLLFNVVEDMPNVESVSIAIDKHGSYSHSPYALWGAYRGLNYTARQRAEALLWVLTKEGENTHENQ